MMGTALIYHSCPGQSTRRTNIEEWINFSISLWCSNISPQTVTSCRYQNGPFAMSFEFLFTIWRLIAIPSIFAKIATSKRALWHLILILIRSSSDKTSKPFGLKWSDEPIKALGVYYLYDIIILHDKNFIERFYSVKKLINIWSSRGLSIYGRVTITKSLIMPKYIYISSLLAGPQGNC